MDVSASHRRIRVTTPDGLGIDAQVWGSPSSREVLLVHGMLQCHLSWSRQVEYLAARNFMLVTYDLRGHGGSDKPLDPKFYNDSGRLADELRAVMAAADLKRPVVVGWSFGTRVIADYLLRFGSSELAGIILVAPVTSPNADHFGPGINALARARDDDLSIGIEGTRAFLRACFSREPSRDEFETMLVYNAFVPLRIRRWFGRAMSDAEAVQAMWRSLSLPVLIAHGLEDQVVRPELSRWLTELMPTAEISLYQNSGHAPFFEEAQKFNFELESFVARAYSRQQEVCAP
jgi:non-heme chloroperoxidase